MDLLRWFRCLRKPAHTAPIAKARLQACPAPIRRPALVFAGKKIVMDSEGLKLKPYLCPAGIPTIGWGATYGPDMNRVTMDDDSISPGVANSMFERDMRHFSDRVRNLINVTVTDNQFSALVSLSFNIGAGAFKRSTLLRNLNAGDTQAAADQFRVWRKGTVGGIKVVLPGLVKRRALERALFLS